MRDWAETAFCRRARDAGLKFDAKRFEAELMQAVPAQAMCEAIANTAKHSRFDDGKWPNGQVTIDWEDGDEDSPSGWILRNHVGGASRGLAVNGFADLPKDWWTHLVVLDLVEGPMRLPEWQQRKLKRMFGRPPE